MGIETIIDKETAKLAGKMLIPVYGGAVVYKEVLSESWAPKYVRALACTYYAVAALTLEINIAHSIYRIITN